MLKIEDLVKMRKMVGISQLDISDEMLTTKQTISNIELGKSENLMATRFYRITVLKMMRDLSKEKKEDLIADLKNIIEYLETGKDEI